jgi:hypothetical protein
LYFLEEEEDENESQSKQQTNDILIRGTESKSNEITLQEDEIDLRSSFSTQQNEADHLERKEFEKFI